jgi:hypothetical protein
MSKTRSCRSFRSRPRDWEAEYRLLAPSAFIVTASIRNGKVDFVELQSLAGSQCTLRNPWGEAGITLYRNGRKAGDLAGGLLVFGTAKEEDIVIAPKGASVDALKRGL